MDYTRQSLSFKIKKVVRYLGLYGFRRTARKVTGQYHLKKVFRELPKNHLSSSNHARVGLIGCGNFPFTTIAHYLRKNYGNIIRGAMDVDVNRAASLFTAHKLRYFTTDPKEVISDPDIDLIFVASNHSTHAEYAIDALAAGKSVHIEKPHVVSMEQLMRLSIASEKSAGHVVGLGFNRPHSSIGRATKKALEREQGPAMMNWFVAGHEIPEDHWYFKEEEGGRVLGNLCHWSDFVYQMVPSDARYPIKITPTRWEKSDCGIAVTYTFGNGTIAAITFSTKGHTFEGVRERFSARKGNTLIYLEDFKFLTIEVVDRKKRISLWRRDHGHEAAIKRSCEGAWNDNSVACSTQYIWETGELFLKTKEALEDNKVIVVDAYNEALLL